MYAGERKRAADRLERAALALADADGDDTYQRAKRNHQDAARWYAFGLGKSSDVERLFREVRAALRKLKDRLK